MTKIFADCPYSAQFKTAALADLLKYNFFYEKDAPGYDQAKLSLTT